MSTTADQLNTLGNQAFMAGELAKAEQLYIAASEADPQNPDTWGNIGLVWHTIGSLDDALKCYMRALALNPDQSRTLCNLGILNEEMGFVEHAERLFLRALDLEPTHARTIGNLAQLYLKRFDFERGWSMIERRFSAGQIGTMDRVYDIPRWNGLPTRKLAVWPEQGVGDQILYSTLLPRLAALGQPFVCELDPRLVPIYQRSFPSYEFVPRGHKDGFDGCTAHVPIMSLGFFFVRRISDLADRDPVTITPDPGRLSPVNRLMGPCDGKRVAISWRSFHPDINKRLQDRKSATLGDFSALLRRHDLQVFSVQYGRVGHDIAACGYPPRILDVDLFNDIEGILAIIANCDAVVTTSNVTAHFAGAMGKETYLISAGAPPLFYWRSPGEHSLWYPSVRVIAERSFEESVAKALELL